MERMKHYLKKFEDQIHQRPNEPALCDYQGASYTYKDVATLIEEYHRFFNAVGIQKGDKIALCARNSARWAIMFLAVNTYGAVIVPILPNYLAPGIAQLIRHSDSQLLLTDPELWAQLSKESLPQIRAVVSVKENKILWSEDQEIVSAWEQRFCGHHQLHLRHLRRPQGRDAHLRGHVGHCGILPGAHLQRS